VDDRSKHDHSGWEEVVLAARERARTRQALMVERFGLSGDMRYHWSMTTHRSHGRAMSRWLWSWANESLLRAVLGDIDRVRQFGEANDYPVLPWPGFNHHPELVAEARMAAASVLDADGLWVESTDDVQLHFLIHDLARAAAVVRRTSTVETQGRVGMAGRAFSVTAISSR
jgi:hypothetical protein